MAPSKSTRALLARLFIYTSITATTVLGAFTAVAVQQASTIIFSAASLIGTIALTLLITLNIKPDKDDPSPVRFFAEQLERISKSRVYIGFTVAISTLFSLAFVATILSVKSFWAIPPAGGQVLISNLFENHTVREQGIVKLISLPTDDDSSLASQTNCIHPNQNPANTTQPNKGTLLTKQNFPVKIITCSDSASDPDSRMFVVGSGTVEGFINRVNPNLLDQSKKGNLLVLQGASSTGIKVLAEAFDHGLDPNNRTVLAMSSIRYSSVSAFQTHNPGFFEIDLGPSRIHAYFVRPQGAPLPNKTVSGETVDNRWWTEQDCRIPVSELVKWLTVPMSLSECAPRASSQYSISLTSADSGTRRTIESSSNNFKDRCWISDQNFGLKLSALDAKASWIAVGSEVNESTESSNQVVNRCEVVLPNAADQERHILLYGRVDRNRRTTLGYRLANDTCSFLNRLLPEVQNYWEHYASHEVARHIEAQRSNFIRISADECYVADPNRLDLTREILRYNMRHSERHPPPAIGVPGP